MPIIWWSVGLKLKSNWNWNQPLFPFRVSGRGYGICVCASVSALLAQLFDVHAENLVEALIFIISRMTSKIKVIGQRSRSTGCKTWSDFDYLAGPTGEQLHNLDGTCLMAILYFLYKVLPQISVHQEGLQYIWDLRKVDPYCRTIPRGALLFTILTTCLVLLQETCLTSLNPTAFVDIYCRKCIFSGCYKLGEDDLKRFVNLTHSGLKTLNLNHCYWLPQRTLLWITNK